MYTCYIFTGYIPYFFWTGQDQQNPKKSCKTPGYILFCILSAWLFSKQKIWGFFEVRISSGICTDVVSFGFLCFSSLSLIIFFLRIVIMRRSSQKERYMSSAETATAAVFLRKYSIVSYLLKKINMWRRKKEKACKDFWWYSNLKTIHSPSAWFETCIWASVM